MSIEAAMDKNRQTYQEPLHVVYIVDAPLKLASLTFVVDSNLNEGNQLRCPVVFLCTHTERFLPPIAL
jgi:hypothetical protein